MKKMLVLLSGAVLFLAGCKKSGSANEEAVNNDEATLTTRQCAAQEVLEEQLRTDPTLRARMDAIEEFTREFQRNPDAGRLLPDGTIEIPVVVNVLYNTAAENVSDAQIASQIDVLNEDFSAGNSDYNHVPNVFKPFRSGDIGVRFVLETVNRRSTTNTSWGLNDAMKKSQRGGIDGTAPLDKLNIWVCDLAGGYLGYAYFPGMKPTANQGVVIDYQAFGTTGSAEAPFDLGRTATHEVGHWLNLYHTWGDDGNSCNGSDLVDDTPNQADENYGCPSFPQISCSNGPNGDMYMNYMDYTDDPCMMMFSAGQRLRMLAVFAAGGPRNNLAQ